MRNWFILFTTTFTMTTLILTLTTVLLPIIGEFNSQYVLFLAISSALLSFFLNLFNKLPIDNFIVGVFIDISFIFIIVYSTGLVIRLHPFEIISFLVTLFLVIIIYIVISLIYLFILTKEADDMNKIINNWRDENAHD